MSGHARDNNQRTYYTHTADIDFIDYVQICKT